MHLFKKAAHLVGPVLFIFIFIKFIDINIFVITLKTVSLRYWLSAIIFNMLFILGKIYRLHFLMNKSEIKIKFFYLSKIYSYSFLLGQMSNVLVADIANISILFKDQKNKLRISNIFIINKVADFLMICLIFLICLTMNTHILNIHINYEKVISISLIFLLLILIVFIYFFKSKFLIFIKDFIHAARSFSFHIIVFTIIIYSLSAISVVNHAKAFNIDVPVSFLLLVNSLGNLITVLPISLSGIGTRDLTFIALMNLVNISSEKALLLSSVGYIITPIFSITAIYIASLIGLKYEDRRHS